ncbi:MAG: tRNA (adenosine(37)-N6)-threonylcarbamoyltransferase complex ATPase subunit type 1 TsaE [Bacillota bacterium]|jgi:tRNA threonylcarbamoyladenosine biosynthesis protein TsaE
MTETVRIMSHSPAETIAIGCGLGKLLQPGDILCLAGGLGAGKTCLARGVAMGLGADEARVSSPTFVLAQEYRGRIPMYHLDLYRLRSAEEVEDAGLDEYIGLDGVAVIEWPDVYGPLLNMDRLTVDIATTAAFERELILAARGDRYIRILEEMRPC